MQEMITTYSIGEVAEKFGLSLPTIRYYDKEGLIPNLNKNEAGVRRFTDENVGSLQMIECLKNAGMPIRDIKQFMQWTLEGDASLDKRYQMFQELRVSVLKQMEAMQNTLNTIDFKCKYYGKATEDGTEKYVKEEMHLERP
ncbi:transcriptional regulator [Companilactobacillus paralimentarius]|uniref:Transcriptional regulator n=3 Tax=Companilactobacillus kimchii TaxID=2801452 RepID=A0ABR5NV32_9LACO|nr:transcriptional regulator [Companilactobacillus kimchii DSM 13961 = JCM 10707]OWF32682.1 HTH-type transcriptional activator TipA [Companilactobacillus kimchii]GEO48508.1 transcriptional regulator [Companilactobacillus paralimentarius]